MDFEKNPIKINQTRICVINSRPAEVQIIEFGSKLDCKKVLEIITREKAPQETTKQISGCLNVLR